MRLGLDASKHISVNSLYLYNTFFTSDFLKETTDNIYESTKKLITSQTEFQNLDKFLSHATNIEEIEFTNAELSLYMLKLICSHTNVKKVNFGGSVLSLDGITFLKDKIEINLDTFKDIEVILGLLENQSTGVEVDISNNSRVADLLKLAPYISDLTLRKLDLTQEDLTKILHMATELRNLKIEECEQIHEVENMEQYQNLLSFELDGKDLFENPGVIEKYSSYSHNVDTIVIDLDEYNGGLIKCSKYNKCLKNLVIVLSPENNFNNIKITGTDSIHTLEIINSNKEEIIRITKEWLEFFSSFKNLTELSFEGCDINFKDFLNLEDLKHLSIVRSNLNNAGLRELPNKCKNLSRIKLTDCRNLTDVSSLAQLESLYNIDVSDNRICKGIDLLINYLSNIDTLFASNNLITNNQITNIFQNSSLQTVGLSRNPITVLPPIPEKNQIINIKICVNECLLGSITANEKFKICNDNLSIERNDYARATIICKNNPFIEPNRYLSPDNIRNFEKQRSVFTEIETLLGDLPEEEKRKEYIKACKRYYNIPENGQIDKMSKIYSAYIGTLAFKGIVCIENDFYYYDGKQIQPIIEKNPQILLQDEKQETDILELYLGEEILSSSNKTVYMYRMLENKPRKLEFENQNILDAFYEQLRERLPESAFVSFMDTKGQTISSIELPKQIDVANDFPKRNFEMDSFSSLLGGIKIKCIHQDGNITFLQIPNEISPLNEKSLELRKANIDTLKELINNEYFYLEQATDADIVIMDDEMQEKKLLDFLTAYLPCNRDEVVTNKTAKQELMESFNLNNYTAILIYGQNVQEEVTEKLDELRKKMTDSSEVEKVSFTLKRLDSVIEKKSELLPTAPKKRGFFQSLFSRKKDEPVYDNSDAEKQAETIEQIKLDLKASATNIIDNISNCKLVQTITRDYGEKLGRYIQVANDKLEELKLQNADNEQIKMLERKIQSLEVSRVLSQQTCMQFELVAKTKANLFEKVCTATQLIPILASQSILRLNLDSENDILELNKNMYQYAQNTIIDNAVTLSKTAQRTLSSEDSIEILRSVIKSVDEIAQATKLGLTPLEGSLDLRVEMRQEEDVGNKKEGFNFHE